MKKNLKDKIQKAFESETPDFSEKIVNACGNEIQTSSSVASVAIDRRAIKFKWLIALIASMLVFAVGMLIGVYIPSARTVLAEETRVYLDVNPSVEFSLDENNTVISCSAINADAEIILNDMKLEGVDLKTALNAIVGAMYVNGFLDSQDNSMLISVATKDTSNTNSYLTYIINQVNKVFENSSMDCAIIAQGVEVNEELKNRAHERGISVGKMHLVDKIFDNFGSVPGNDMLSIFANMSIKDLNLIYTSQHHDNRPGDEMISGSVKVDVTEGEALNAVLNELGKTIDEVKDYSIFVLPSKHMETKVVYAVTLRFYNDNVTYKYEVDCNTGEVAIANPNMPSDELPPDAGGNPPNNLPPDNMPPHNGELPPNDDRLHNH